MCNQCTVAFNELESISVLAEIEQITILAEQDAGLSSPNAVRPLTENEVAAEVRFGDIYATQEDGEREAEAIIRTLGAVVGAGIIGGIMGGKDSVTRLEAVRGLAALTVKQPEAIQLAVAEATEQLTGVFVKQAKSASRIVVAEAKRQGVSIPDTYSPPDPDVDALKLPAAVASMHPYSRVLTKTQSVIADPKELSGPPLTRGALTEVVDSIPLDGAMDLARQGVRQSHGAGRNSTAAQFDPTDIWASELMDGRQCGPCARIDEREYATLEEARRDYPNGGYVRCLGGNRCRGSLVMLYDDPE